MPRYSAAELARAVAAGVPWKSEDFVDDQAWWTYQNLWYANFLHGAVLPMNGDQRRLLEKAQQRKKVVRLLSSPDVPVRVQHSAASDHLRLRYVCRRRLKRPTAPVEGGDAAAQSDDEAAGCWWLARRGAACCASCARCSSLVRIPVACARACAVAAICSYRLHAFTQRHRRLSASTQRHSATDSCSR